MDMVHRMSCVDNTPTDVVYTCDDCGRRVVVGKREPRLVVLDRGDIDVRHVGGTGGLELLVSAATP